MHNTSVISPTTTQTVDYKTSPASTSSLAEAIAVVGIVAPVPTLVTAIIGVELASTGAPTALPGEAC